MTLYRDKYRIETTRLSNYDYSWNGWYFVTICAHNREKYFDVNYTKILMATWKELPIHYSNCQVDEFVVMPDHVHGIICIVDSGRVIETGQRPVSTEGHGLSEMIRGFKTYSAIKINNDRNTRGKPLWQPRFYDRIIRSERELEYIRYYIRHNPDSLPH